MKRALSLAFAALLVWITVQALAQAPRPAGAVSDMAGRVEAQNGKEPARSLSKGAPVFPLDVISTATDKDKATITFVDGSVLDIGPESAVALKDFNFDPERQENSRQSIGMGKGIFRFVTGKLVAQNPDNLKIESPLSVIGIRGTTTDHWIQTRQKTVNGQTVTEVLAELHALRETKTHHEVIVTSDGREMVLDKPGQAAWVRPNLPGEVRALTDEEMQGFGKAPLSRSPFDPPAKNSFEGGGAAQ
jgi:hypothetical protein